MNYYLYTLLWANNEGISPISLAKQNNFFLAPSSFAKVLENGLNILGYSKDELPTEMFSDYNFKKISQNEALEFATSVAGECFVQDSGLIKLKEQEIASITK